MPTSQTLSFLLCQTPTLHGLRGHYAWEGVELLFNRCVGRIGMGGSTCLTTGSSTSADMLASKAGRVGGATPGMKKNEVYIESSVRATALSYRVVVLFVYARWDD